jgi:dolichol-phosphate mannosyltransferase
VSPYIAVMDADLQHDESLLPAMLRTLKSEPFDMVVGSRYIAGGGNEGFDKTRAGISNFATTLSHLTLKVDIADPMSGFFALKRAAFNGAVRRLSAIGFKILVDILASSPVRLRVKELPYHFRERLSGESKLSAQVAWEYIMLLADKMVGHIVPVRYLRFSYSQAIATGVAMVGNFSLNNVFTYNDRKLKGWRFVRGLVSFVLICSIGAVGNVGVSSFIFHTGRSSWWLASIAGIAISSVWNYAVSAVVTWKKA